MDGRYYTEISEATERQPGHPAHHAGGIHRGGLGGGLARGCLRFRLNKNWTPPAPTCCISRTPSVNQFNPFRGPVRDQDGRLRVQPGNDPNPYEILEMEWLCDFIRVVD